MKKSKEYWEGYKSGLKQGIQDEKNSRLSDLLLKLKKTVVVEYYEPIVKVYSK